MEPLIGTISIFAGNYAPYGWAFCNGQLLNVHQYAALYAVLGNRYGGVAGQTFALPNLIGRVPIHFGQGPGLTNRNMAETGGTETVTLNMDQIPVHTHLAAASTQAGNVSDPTGAVPANTGALDKEYSKNPGNVNMNANFLQPVGSGQAHNNMQPSLALNFIIAIEGIFPVRQ